MPKWERPAAPQHAESASRTEGRLLTRLMLTVDDRACSFGCTYCFRDFSQYEAPPTLAAAETDSGLLDGVDVLYPACDVDLFARADAFSVLDRVAALGRTVSISTKAGLSEKSIARLADMSTRMREDGLLLKVAVSITTKYSVSEIEPRTPSYSIRLRTLKRLRDAGVPTALILRPILLDIPFDEHLEIVSEAGVAAGAVVVGDEWVDAQYNRRRTVARGSHEELRSVNWLRGKPTWPLRSATERARELSVVARRAQVEWFESDLDLMRSLIERWATHRV